MKSIILFFISWLSLATHAQPVSLQLTVAHNDKLQKEYGPYKAAITAMLGERFGDEHGPYEERRILCKWDKDWVECGYFRLSHASSLTGEQRRAITEVVRSPCAAIRFDLLKTPAPSRPKATAPFEERMAFAAHEKQEGLLKLCQAGTFEAVAVRVADPHQGRGGRSAPNQGSDEIGFEARMKVPAKSNSGGAAK